MNIPNILTTIRFFLVPTFIYVFYTPSIENNVLIATFVFILAGITDVLDGYIARTYNMVTKWGIALDPLADKLMQLTVLICFTDKGYLPVWVILVVGVKELLMIAGALFLYYFVDRTVIPSNRYGKAATVFFYVAILVIAIDISPIINYFFVLLAVTTTVIAFINYLIGFKEINENSCENKNVDK
ncbi:CDP-diacylglycerol--glycerol-3-phosphate 3-phosphatidyltransferase [Caldisalinibacter kiritimatiensis]|uniref:CDP-diacylglycerol--glycerol-3-phosphate 3-phosphatidyltransferase n=1 Tax=Caldisalinibacter kiritimatiensis TaxID=1304284 RepID=R1CS35_9FIRM|nr:CDP-diacylglycerol--glycerol-3-phosphate 3-phosphatidyltransferase [Caldisalinibacter kiritimatiensis]EOC99493.1 CDP-diacylglycerol--glycerol-3-phosphate 3-phosphatidyltransferase [Caldisalinibacter kiritimatiensis]